MLENLEDFYNLDRTDYSLSEQWDILLASPTLLKQLGGEPWNIAKFFPNWKRKLEILQLLKRSLKSNVLSFNILYCGIGLSGRTSSLEAIHDQTRPERIISQWDVKTLIEEGNHIEFLYFVCNFGKIKNKFWHFQLNVGPSSMLSHELNSLRYLLKSCDGIIFVVDSQTSKLNKNLDYYAHVESFLKAHDREIASIPLVFQYNKRDLPNIMSIDFLNKTFNKWNCPFHETIAYKGTGVLESLRSLFKTLLKDLENYKAI